MTEVSAPGNQPIAAVLADGDGTLVTKTKALTPRAIEAIEQLHERGVIFAITRRGNPRQSSSSRRSSPATMACWTGSSRSSVSATTTTAWLVARRRCSNSSGCTCPPPGRSRSTSM